MGRPHLLSEIETESMRPERAGVSKPHNRNMADLPNPVPRQNPKYPDSKFGQGWFSEGTLQRPARGFGPTLLVWPISREPHFNCTVCCLRNQLACFLESGRSPGIIGKGCSDLDGYFITFFVDERDGRSAFAALFQDASRSLLNVGHATPNRPIRNESVRHQRRPTFVG